MTGLVDRMSVTQAMALAHALTELDDLIQEGVSDGALSFCAHHVDVMIRGRRVATISIDEQGNSDLTLV